MKASLSAASTAESNEPSTESHDRPVVLITGATTGIGAEAAVDLAERGWKVFVHGRDRKRGKDIVSHIRSAGGKAAFLQADFASPDAVRNLATGVRERTEKLDALALNAGLSRSECVDVWGDVEEVFAVNQLAPYLLTHELADVLGAAPSARVVITASTVHTRGELDIDLAALACGEDYDAFGSYARSKLANLLFAFELADRFGDESVTVNAFHPGFVPGSRFYRDVGPLFGAMIKLTDVLPLVGTSVEDGAEPIVRLVDDESVADTTGAYFDGTQRTDPDPRVTDPHHRAQVWNVSANLSGVDPDWP